MGQYVDFYCGNNNKELKKIVDPIIMVQFGWLAQKDYDDFYSIASQVVWDCEKRFNEEKIKNKNFKSFLSSCIQNKIKTHLTYIHRNKRCMKDENGNPIYETSIDMKVTDDEKMTLGDFFVSEFDLENEVCRDVDINEDYDKYLANLSKIQKQIVLMKIDGESVSNIKKKLNLTDAQYDDNMKSIKEDKLIFSLKNKKHKQIEKKVEDKKMEEMRENSVDDILYGSLDLDTTDNYRTDRYPLGSLLDDFGDELSPNYIDRNYISQREPFIWKDKQINKFYSRILNNFPIPEIIICEQKVENEKVSFLIDGLQRLSYAEAFKQNRIPVKADGAEFTNIKYKKRVIGDDGKPKLVEDVFNIIGKYYKDLPEFLQKRFDNFNILVTRFFDCTPEMIDYHIRNYNNHVSMNKAQYAITNVSNAVATNIKTISKKHPFFKDNVKATNTNRKDGSWDEVVARTIMTVNFIDNWKKEALDAFTFINQNATNEHFKRLNDNLDRLSKVTDNTVKDLFTTTNTYIWLAIFDKFVDLDMDDVKFVEFMKSFKEHLHNEKINGKCFNDIYCDRNTRDKKVVVGKVNGLITLMYKFLGINPDDLKEVDALTFVKDNVNPEVTEKDIKEYKEDLDILSLDVDNKSKLLENKNIPSLIAAIAYGYKNDIAIDLWFKDYFNRNNTYSINQKENFLHMIEDLNNFTKANVA